MAFGWNNGKMEYWNKKERHQREGQKSDYRESTKSKTHEKEGIHFFFRVFPISCFRDEFLGFSTWT
jgi:hypothetical protein